MHSTPPIRSTVVPLSCLMLLLAAVGFSAPASLRVDPQPSSRPNILFAIADDMSWASTGASGDRVVRTPTFDRIAREGVNFRSTFCSSPSCTPSRGAILTGQEFYRLGEGGNLWSMLPKKYPVYPDLLEQAGYHVGLQMKGWGPGNFQAGGRTRNPAGPNYRNFEQFLKTVPEGKPFCFWYGSHDPHRAYVPGTGVQSGLKPEDVRVPPFLPDNATVRSDILDYYFEVERFDRQVGEIVQQLEAAKLLDNTLIIITADNGMPFPRAKANVYDYGARLPLAIRWPARVRGGRTSDRFVSFTDYAPTILEAAGLKPPGEMTGKSLLPLLTAQGSHEVPGRDHIIIGRERHASCRVGNVGYPIRAIRTKEYLYIRNLEPDRWPAGDPTHYGDIDNGPSKQFMMDNRQSDTVRPLYQMAFEKRPAEELYDLRTDPGQMKNVSTASRYQDQKKRLRADLDAYLRRTGDPRSTGPALFDSYPYYGPRNTIPAAPVQQQ